MDKISSIQNSFFHRSLKEKKSKDTKKGSKSKKTLFSSLLSSEPEEAEVLSSGIGIFEMAEVSEENFHQALDDIYLLGDRIKQEPVMKNLQNYKNGLKKVFKYVLSNGLDTERQKRYFNPLKMKAGQEYEPYTIVRIIDKKLENLAVSILRDQTDQIKILAEIDEIKGLLVNLLR